MKPVKRIDRLILGIQELATSWPGLPIEWCHLGGGALQAELQALASAALPPNVSWRFEGELKNQSVVSYYRSNPVDVFVNVSASEGIPVSIMEAQSFGIPVIATSVGGTPEVVNKDNGILLSPNPQRGEIAVALRELSSTGRADNRNRRVESKKMWRTRFNADVNYGDFADRIRAL